MACTNLSGYFKSLNLINFICLFLNKQLILCSEIDWRIGRHLMLISQRMFGASIWANFMIRCLSWTRLQRNNRCLSFYVFKGGEPGRDKVSEIDSYLFYSFYYYYSHGYSCLHSAIQGMCPMMTLALTTTKCWTWRLNPTESDLQQMRWPNNQIRSATTVKLMCRVLTLSIINELSVELIKLCSRNLRVL